MSYRELDDSIGRLAGVLKAKGIKKGDRIALLMHNCPEFLISFYAAMKIGLICVSLNVMLTADEIDYILKDSDPNIIIAHEKYLPALEQTAFFRLKKLQLIVVSSETCPKDALGFQSACESALAPAETEPLKPEDDAVIAYTSGTTGVPKGVVHTQGSILFGIGVMQNHLDLGGKDIILCALPFFQLPAFIAHPGIALHAGGTLVFLKKFEVDTFLKSIKSEKVTYFGAVPAIYHMISAAANETPVDLSSVRFGICAGAPLSEPFRKEFEKRFSFRIVHPYGATELPPFITCEDPGTPPKGISVGRPLPHATIKLVKDNDSPAKTGEEGEIYVLVGKGTFKRYWRAYPGTEAAIKDGWFATGDLGRFDEEGHLYIVDRKKDMIIRGGFNIYPAEIERVICQDGRVQELAVVGVPHERLGEVPKAYVALKPGCCTTAAEIMALCREKLAKYKVPEIIEFVDGDFFPRNAMGKILKRELKCTVGRGDEGTSPA